MFLSLSLSIHVLIHVRVHVHEHEHVILMDMGTSMDTDNDRIKDTDMTFKYGHGLCHGHGHWQGLGHGHGQGHWQAHGHWHWQDAAIVRDMNNTVTWTETGTWTWTRTETQKRTGTWTDTGTPRGTQTLSGTGMVTGTQTLTGNWTGHVNWHGQGHGPHRNLCRCVWCPTEICSDEYDIPRKLLEWFDTLQKFVHRGVWHSVALFVTLLNHVKKFRELASITFSKLFACKTCTTQGLKDPCLRVPELKLFVLLRGFSDPGNHFWLWISPLIRNKIQQNLGFESGVHMGLDYEKIEAENLMLLFL